MRGSNRRWKQRHPVLAVAIPSLVNMNTKWCKDVTMEGTEVTPTKTASITNGAHFIYKALAVPEERLGV